MSSLFLWSNKIRRNERKRTFTRRMKNRFGIYDVIVPENESNMKKIKGSSAGKLHNEPNNFYCDFTSLHSDLTRRV